MLVEENRRPALWAWNYATLGLVAALAAIGTIYFLTPAANHAEAEDSVWYLKAITFDAFPDQFHPNHLLFQPINYLFYHAWKLLGYPANAAWPVRVLNVAAALASLWLVYRISASLEVPLFARFFAVIGTGFSYGFWWYTVEAQSNLLPMVFVLLSLHRLILIREDPLNPRHSVLLGLCNGAAMVLHQQHFLLLAVSLLGYMGVFWQRRRAIPASRFLGPVLICLVTCGALVFTIYLGAAVLGRGLHDLGGLRSWVTSGSVPGGFGYGLSLESMKAVLGAGRALIGGHFIFGFPAVAALIERLVQNYELRDKMFLVKDFSPLRNYLLAALTVIMGAVVLAGVVDLLRRRRPGSIDNDNGAARRFAFWLLGAYLVSYSLFNLYWLPESIEFWVCLTPVAYLLVALLLAPAVGRPAVKTGMGAFLACLFLINLFGSVLPQNDLRNDYWYAFNSWLLNNSGPGDLVVSGAGYISDGYVEFYSGAKVLPTAVTDKNLRARFDWAIDYYRPKRVILSSSVLSPRQLRGHTLLDPTPAREFFAGIMPELTLLHSDSWQDIYLYNAGTS